MHPLPVERLWGVGPVTLERLRRLGVRTVGELASIDESAVIASLGKANGTHLLNLARGIDDRPVEVNRELKSIGHEETFAHDLHDPADLDRELVRLCDAVASRLRERRIGARTLTLKVRFAGFETITRSTTGAEPVDTGPSIVVALRPLLDRIDPTPGVRLLGVSASNFGEPVRPTEPARPCRPGGFGRRRVEAARPGRSTRSATGSERWRSAQRAPSGEMACASSVRGRSSGAPITIRPMIAGRRVEPIRLRWRVEQAGRTCDDGAQQRVGMTGCHSPRTNSGSSARSSKSSNRTPRSRTAAIGCPRRRLVLLLVGLVAGLAVTIAGLAVSFWLAFVGFVAVLVMAVLLESEIRVLGRERLGALPISAWLGGARRPGRRADD